MNEINIKKFSKEYSIEIALIVATQIELDTALSFLSEYEDTQGKYKISEGNNTFYCGLFGQYSTVIVKTNSMGTIQAGASLQTTAETIKLFKPKAVIMGGIAFGVDSNKQNFGDILVSKSIIPYNPSRYNQDGSIDYRASIPNSDLTLFNRFSQESKFTSHKTEKDITIRTGALLTGEILIDNQEFKTQLLERFPNAIGGEMEGTGIYAVCETHNKTPWIIIKSICDWADGTKNKTQQQFAATISFEFIYETLQSKIIFESLNILPYISKENTNPEINIDALDILNLIVSKRDMKQLSSNQGTRNRDKKIYYEYYSFKDSNILKGFLFLGNNITLKNIFDDFIEKQKNQLPNSLEIFLAKKKTSTHTVDRKKAIKDRITEYTLEKENNGNIHYIDDVIREYTSIKKDLNNSHKRKDFIDQNIYAIDNITKKKFLIGESLSYFTDELDNQTLPISIVVGSGGVGKTTFCDTLQYTINHMDGSTKKVFYIKGEKVVNFFLSSNEQQIKSLENLYEIYKEETDFNEIDKEDFHLNYIAGNVIVIIDAIEEIESAMNERFDLKLFFNSLNELHKRFYSTKIILTTREHFMPKIEAIDDGFGIKYYELRGFEEENLDAFLNKRYDTENQEEKKIKVKKFLSENQLIDQEGHIIPLFVDWVCKIIDRPETHNIKDSKYFISTFQMDKLLINLIQREITKQSLNIDIDGMFKLLEEIIIHNNGKISKEDFKEYIEIETNGDANNYLKNPLFNNQRESITIKYDILNNIIKARYLRYSLLNKQTSSDQILRLLKDLYLGKGDLFNELSLLFKNEQENTTYETVSYFISDFIKKYNLETSSIKKENIRKSISSLLYLVMSINTSLDKDKVTQLLQKVYNSTTILRGVFIYGDFYPINFMDIRIHEGLFDNYNNLIKCTFPNEDIEIFTYVTFRYIHLPTNKKIKKIFFSETCIHEDSNILEITTYEENSSNKKIEQYRQDIISLTKYIETSQKSENLIKRHCNIKYQKGEKKFLNKLIGEGYIELSHDLYKISSSFYDDIPSIKLGDFPDSLEKILLSL